ncbi:MAG: hypothetical protein JXR10_01795 [Cyclobacteriaceae bacterium]
MDFSYVVAVGDGDETFIATFIQTFEGNTSKIINEMRDAKSNGKLEELKSHAHQLKPSLEMLHLSCLDQCVTINQSPEKATSQMIEDIQSQCAEAVAGMREYFKVG